MSLTIPLHIQSNREFFFAKKISRDETYFSPFCRPQEAHSRISRTYAHARRPRRDSGPPRQGPGPVERLSVRGRYSRRLRLGTTDIAALLASGRALRRSGFSVLLRANAFGVPRLGLIVPKRVFPRAVDRNRMKRVLRELFRAQQARLGSRDILIRVNSGKFSLAEVEQCLVGAQ